MKVIAIKGSIFIQLFHLESKKQLASLDKRYNENFRVDYNNSYEDFNKCYPKVEIELDQDLYNTALNFNKIKDSVIQDIFIETIENLMNERQCNKK
jgi:cystathionine beta-lyase/cystathionine gamma-synthase